MKPTVALLGALGLAILSCGGEDKELGLVTFNTGLARGYLPYARERAPLIGKAIAELGADVVCLQEVWKADDVEAIQQTTKGKLKESFFLDPDPGEVTAGASCTDEDRAPLEICARASCDVPADELAGCVLKFCSTEFNAVSQPCTTCLYANVGEELDTMIENCTTMMSSYSYNGSFGIGLLSKHELGDRDHLVMDSTGNRRAILHAAIDTSGFGKVHVFCTHLTPIWKAVEYNGSLGSWEAEMATQMGWIIDFMEEKTAGAGLAILLGDLNSGPAVGAISAEAAENFQILIDAGFEDPYLDSPAPQCTYCGDNTLVQEDKDREQLIDHILLKDFEGKASAERILEAPVTVVYHGESITTELSDHYGVRVKLTPP